jgi:hypothetical protein
MGKVGSGFVVGATLAVLAFAGTASAAIKTYCCYRVTTSGSLTIFDESHAGEIAGGSNGTFSLGTDWQARELMAYRASQPGTGAYKRLERLRLRAGREIVGRAQFSGNEQSRQYYYDSERRRVDYPPCDYSYSDPWRRDRGSAPLTQLRDGVNLYLRSDTGLVLGQYEGDCDNTVPNFGALGGWVLESDQGRSSSEFDSFTASLHRTHTDPPFRVGKLKKLKDYAVEYAEVFEQSGTVSDDPRTAHTVTVGADFKIRFNWFPRDRLQKEANGLEALK